MEIFTQEPGLQFYGGNFFDGKTTGKNGKAQIYRGAIPFVGIQLLALLLLAVFPDLVTWLPGKIYGN